MGRLVIIVPLREGAEREAQALLRQGPPLDLEEGGLQRFQAFLTSREAILVLEGPGVGTDRDGPPWDDLSTWREGRRWQRCAQSPPRMAASIHHWQRATELDGVFFGPLPGPGDSEGGDPIGA